MSKKLQEQIDKIKKSIVNKNLTNTSMATYGKLNEIGRSLYRYDQLSKAGLKDEAKAESTKTNNLISNFNNSEDGEPLKGYISNATRFLIIYFVLQFLHEYFFNKYIFALQKNSNYSVKIIVLYILNNFNWLLDCFNWNIRDCGY